MKEGDTLYMMRFTKKDPKTKGLKLVRGMSLASWEPIEGKSELRLKVKLDSVQYQMDLVDLAVQESMFVQDIYAQC